MYIDTFGRMEVHRKGGRYVVVNEWKREVGSSHSYTTACDIAADADLYLALETIAGEADDE